MNEKTLRAFLGSRVGAREQDIFGVRVSGPASSLRALATHVVGVDGVPAPRGEKPTLDEAIASYGWIRTADASFYVHHGEIVRMSLQGHLLGHVRSEADLIGMMGPPTVRLGVRGRVEARYVSRQITVFLELAPFRVSHMLLGEMVDESSSSAAVPTLVLGGVPARPNTLQMRAVYAGLLEGLPTREMNADIVERARKEALALAHHVPVHVVEPPQTPIDYPRRYPFGSPASLPSIACIGGFTSGYCARDIQQDGSELMLVWFQARMGLPDPTVLADVPWCQLARDFEH